MSSNFNDLPTTAPGLVKVSMAEKFVRGIYYISHFRAPIVVDMLSGDGTSGARIGAWWKVEDSGLNSLNQLWYIEPVNTGKEISDTKYTICNLRSGSYIDLADPSRANGPSLVGRPRNGTSQEWLIYPDTLNDGALRIRNSVTGTYVNLHHSNTSEGAKITGWEWVGYGPPRFDQLWTFQRVSRTGEELFARAHSTPAIASVDLSNFQPDGVYYILPRALLSSIHDKTGLKRTRRRSEIFDSDDFAFVLKTVIAKWADSNLRADGFRIHCGVVFGKNATTRRAFNWTLLNHEPDAPIIFVDPQNGEMQENTPWDYSVYFALV